MIETGIGEKMKDEYKNLNEEELENAVKNGDYPAFVYLANIYKEKGDTIKYIETHKRGMELGFVESYIALAKDYAYGKGSLKKNKKEAFRILEEGISKTQDNYLYFLMWEFSKKSKKYMDYLVKAANEGLLIAQYNLANEYKNKGKLNDALIWYNVAMNNKNSLDIKSMVINTLAELYLKTNQVEKGVKLLQDSSEHSSDCLATLGSFYIQGVGVTKDTSKGFTYLLQAFNKDIKSINVHNKINLLECFVKGIGTKVDLDRAKEVICTIETKEVEDLKSKELSRYKKLVREVYKKRL